MKNKAVAIAEGVWLKDRVAAVAVEYDDDTMSSKL